MIYNGVIFRQMYYNPPVCLKYVYVVQNVPSLGFTRLHWVWILLNRFLIKQIIEHLIAVDYLYLFL